MTRGGARPGAGRPKGLGKFGEKTRPLRVPERMIPQILHFIKNPDNPFNIPIYSKNIVEDSEKLNLNNHLIKNPSANFFVKITDDTMQKASILPGDIVLVTNSETADSGNIIAALLDKKIIVRRYIKKEKREYLLPENSACASLEITKKTNFHLLGIITNVIHQF